jgi:uncharacterized OB-fold protein
MGLFENLGKKVERFKQQATDAASEEANHVCGDCGELIYADREQCPNCGSEDIRERTASDE